MAEGEDWLMRPVLRGLCKYESLLTGRVGLYDLALMNEALDVEAENQMRVHDAHKDQING